MSAFHLPIGCFVRIEKPDLQAIIGKLRALDYRVIGPRMAEGAVILDDLERADQLPIGYAEEQEAGRYRLLPTADSSYFAYVVGPHSLKKFLFPPRLTLLESRRQNGTWHMLEPPPPPKPLAVLGVRSCDLHALATQDRILLRGRNVDPAYQARRQGLFLLGVNCGRAAPTCFCTSINTGPAIRGNVDLALFEMPNHFVLEVGSERGGEVLAAAAWRPCTSAELNEAVQIPQRAAAQIRRRLETLGVHELLMQNLEHEHWEEVAGRCLACTNCTQVCPTCFCMTVHESCDLTGTAARRERLWDSCFNDEHSYMNSGMIRRATTARYRQWLTHKLATWQDQFGTTGCVGCGRCITWCPVGIDLTQEVAAIRGGTP
jgi:ferredoxin